jgi:hypothetical protein
MQGFAPALLLLPFYLLFVLTKEVKEVGKMAEGQMRE